MASNPRQNPKFMEMLSKGLDAMNRGDFELARQRFEALRARFPQSPEGPHLLGLVALQERDFVAAARWLQQAARGKPKDPDVHLQHGIALAGAGRLKDSIRCFGRCLELAPANQTALGLLVDAAVETDTVENHLDVIRSSAAGVSEDKVLVKCGVALADLGENEAARVILERNAQLHPDSHRAQFNLGTLLFNLGKLEASTVALRSAYELQPEWQEGVATLFKALLPYSDEEALAFAVAHTADFPNDPDGPMLQSRAHRARGCIVEARAVIEPAFERFPGVGPVLAEYVTVGLELGDLAWVDAAIDAARVSGINMLTVLNLESRRATMVGDESEAFLALKQRVQLEFNAAACVNLAESSRTEDRVDEAMALIEDGSRGQTMGLLDQAHVEFALGKLLDRKGDHRAGFERILEANRLKYAWMRMDGESSLPQIPGHVRSFSAAQLRPPARTGSDSPTPILIVGLPRSGTTLTESILSAHPAIGASGERCALEPALADVTRRIVEDGDQAEAAGLDELNDAAGRYLRQLAAFQTEQESFVTDKTPHNFRILGLARRMFPDSPVIHCRRHVLDCAVSNFFADFQAGDAFALNRGLAYTHDMRAFAHAYHEYRALMAQWRDHGVVIYESDYETLVSNPDLEIPKMLEYVGVPFDSACLLEERTNRPVLTASAFQVRQRISPRSVGRWRRYAAYLAPLAEALGDALAPEDHAVIKAASAR